MECQALVLGLIAGVRISSNGGLKRPGGTATACALTRTQWCIANKDLYFILYEATKNCGAAALLFLNYEDTKSRSWAR